MAKRRANGEGSIRKRKDGRWEGRYTAGHDPDTGKQIFKNVTSRSKRKTQDGFGELWQTRLYQDRTVHCGNLVGCMV